MPRAHQNDSYNSLRGRESIARDSYGSWFKGLKNRNFASYLKWNKTSSTIKLSERLRNDPKLDIDFLLANMLR
ncbi:Opacity protein [Dirofilaria immitis]